MTILADNGEKTFYVIESNHLSRPVDGKLYRVDLLEDDRVAQVFRLANLDNESFKLLAELQIKKRLYNEGTDNGNDAH